MSRLVHRNFLHRQRGVLRLGLGVSFGAESSQVSEPGEWIGKTAHYVREAATGSGDGSDWTNAYTALPASLTRDHVYYVATGSYSSYDCNDTLSTTLKIYIVKATVADHGTETGWSAGYASQATFNAFTMTTGYYVIDGQTRTETNRMEAPAGYGFRCTGGIGADSIGSQNGSNSTFRYLDIGGTWSEEAWSEAIRSLPSNCVRFVYDQTNLTFERCCFHNAGVDGALAMMHGSSNVIWDHCDFYFGWGKATVATPNVGQNFHTTRYCRFWNATQLDQGAEGGGITTELGTYSYSGTTEGNLVHGCVFHSTVSGGRNSVIQYGESSPGPTAVDCKAHHNTFVGIPEDPVFAHIYLYSGSGNEARNNLAYDCAGSLEITANSASDNTEVVSDPFVDYANRDFRLASSPGTGSDLGAPYSTDFAGNARGSSPHLGAYAYTG